MISPVFYNSDATKALNSLIEQKTKVFVLVDEATHELCWPKLADKLNNAEALEIIEIPSGEENKQLTIFSQIIETLCEMGADKKSLLINLGGGMITDMGGYVASAYMRGIEYVNIPTTLLAMVDAAHGGKTGVDLGVYKNLVGAMYASSGVLVYPEFLETLNATEYASGYAEALKHGLISNAKLWDKLKNEIAPVAEMRKLLPEIIQVKLDIVKADPNEKNVRKTLNLGHNIGHAIESYFLSQSNPIPHGYAVVLGMLYENEMASNMRVLAKSEALEINAYLLKLYPALPKIKDGIEVILKNLDKDKKNEKGILYYSPLSKIGTCEFHVAFEKRDCEKALELAN